MLAVAGPELEEMQMEMPEEITQVDRPPDWHQPHVLIDVLVVGAAGRMLVSALGASQRLGVAHGVHLHQAAALKLLSASLTAKQPSAGVRRLQDIQWQSP